MKGFGGEEDFKNDEEFNEETKLKK